MGIIAKDLKSRDGSEILVTHSVKCEAEFCKLRLFGYRIQLPTFRTNQ
jgi:hypothetical protein